MRKLSGFWKVTVSILSISLVLFHIYTTMTGILSDIYQRDIHLGFVLTLCFLLKPATKNSPKDRVPFYDIIFACLSLISAVYVATIYGVYIFFKITEIR